MARIILLLEQGEGEGLLVGVLQVMANLVGTLVMGRMEGVLMVVLVEFSVVQQAMAMSVVVAVAAVWAQAQMGDVAMGAMGALEVQAEVELAVTPALQ